MQSRTVKGTKLSRARAWALVFLYNLYYSKNFYHNLEYIALVSLCHLYYSRNFYHNLEYIETFIIT